MAIFDASESPVPGAQPGHITRLGITVSGAWIGLRESVLLSHLRGKGRRFWLVNFRPGYVRRQLARRQGDCRQCGVCCALGNTCPLLHRTRHCLIYRGYRPTSCCVFPIDERDVLDVKAAGGSCGYSFPVEAAK